MDGNVRPTLFQRWVQLQDESEHEGSEKPTDFLAAIAIAILLAATAAAIPSAGSTHGMRDFVRSLLALVPLMIHSLLTARNRSPKQGHRRSEKAWVYSIVDSLLTLFWMAFMAVNHAGAVHIAFAVLFTANTAYYGYLYRSGGSAPVIAMVTFGSAGAAILLSPALDMSTLVFGMLALTGAAMSVFAGNVAVSGDVRRKETAGLRAALHAQQLEEQVRQADRLEATLSDIIGIHHDAANTLTTAVLSAEALVERCRENAAALPAGIARLSEYLAGDLEKVRQLMSASKATGRETLQPPPLEEVPLRPILDDVVAATSRSHPAVHVALVDHGVPERVLVRGGANNLRRMVENLLLNACQGDGKSSAGKIEIELLTEGVAPKTRVTIRDDGPGFPKQIIEAPIDGFVSTKAEGTGFGIYTVEKLVRASGGSLQRANRSVQGAEVSFTLPAGPSGLELEPS